MQKSLVLLVADNNMEKTFQALLQRPHALGIRPIEVNLVVHPHRDPGVLREAHEFLRPFLRECKFALVVLDLEGCGREHQSAEQLSQEVQQRLDANG